jgi:hypothetical protein
VSFGSAGADRPRLFVSDPIGPRKDRLAPGRRAPPRVEEGFGLGHAAGPRAFADRPGAKVVLAPDVLAVGAPVQPGREFRFGRLSRGHRVNPPLVAPLVGTRRRGQFNVHSSSAPGLTRNTRANRSSTSSETFRVAPSSCVTKTRSTPIRSASACWVHPRAVRRARMFRATRLMSAPIFQHSNRWLRPGLSAGFAGGTLAGRIEWGEQRPPTPHPRSHVRRLRPSPRRGRGGPWRPQPAPPRAGPGRGRRLRPQRAPSRGPPPGRERSRHRHGPRSGGRPRSARPGTGRRWSRFSSAVGPRTRGRPRPSSSGRPSARTASL